jgi:ABC-2 type transport system permease protein
MKIRPRALLGFIKKEFIQIFRDKKMIGAIFFIPIIQLIMFGTALTSEVRNIKFAVISKPTEISREIETKAFASGWFKKAKGVSGARVSDPAELILSQKAEAVLIAPKEGFEFAFERGGKPVQLLINAINAQRAQQIDMYVKQIIMETAKELGYDITAAGIINIDVRIMYNHYMNTSDYMLPALIAMASFIVLLAVCSMSITKEKETGTMEKLISSPSTGEEILLGKIIPYMIIGMLIILFMFAVSLSVFKIAFRGYFWQLLITGFLLILIALSLATLISAIAKTQQQALMASILFILPAILLSGVFFPIENIPAQFRWMSYVDPLTYAMANFRNIFLKGGDMIMFWQYSIISLIIGVILALSALKNFKSKLN